MKRKRSHFKLGLLFIVLLFSLLFTSVSYSHWEEITQIHVFSQTTSWDEPDPHYLACYEDWRVNDSIDYDYNDFIVEVSCEASYISGNLVQLDFVFNAKAQGSMDHHSLFLSIPRNTFGCDGNYNATYFDSNESVIASVNSPFYDEDTFKICVFENTSDCFSDNLFHDYLINTLDNTGFCNGSTTSISLTFSGLFAEKDVELVEIQDINCHGENQFFNLILYNLDSGDYILFGDNAVIVTPVSCLWPEEIEGFAAASIWGVYPYNATSQQGVSEGFPPIFSEYWYNENPTDLCWNMEE